MRLIDADELLKVIRIADKHDITGLTDLVHNTETVKAIPIEWIEKKMKRLDEDIKWAWYYGNTALDKMEYLKMWLTLKLEEWEKENETN